MVKTCVCIEPVFQELNYLEKIKKISELGFSAIEFWFWDHEFDSKGLNYKKKDINRISGLSKELKIEISDMVVNSPDGSIGGSLNNPGDRQNYLKRLRETIDVAKELNCKKLITCTGNKMSNLSQDEQTRNVTDTLKEAVRIAGENGITLVLEALNSRVDHPGYFLDSSRIGFDIVKGN